MINIRDFFNNSAVRKTIRRTYGIGLLAIGTGGVVSGAIHAARDEPYAIHGIAGGVVCVLLGTRKLVKMPHPNPE